MDYTTLKPHDTSKIVQLNFPDDQYHKEETTKSQIVIHHTVSGTGIEGDVATWLGDTKRIATCVIIDRKGIVHQCFSSKFWGSHLGIKADWLKARGHADYTTRNVELDKHSISIELDSWGQLEKVGDKQYKTAYGNIVSNIEVSEFPNKFRDSVYYEKYTEAQIKSLGEMLLYWAEKFNIPLDYNEDMWNISDKAIRGKPGIFTHVSYRPDKSDCCPDVDLISMLKSLKK